MGLISDYPPSAASWSPSGPATISRVDAAEAEFSWTFNEEFASIARTAYLIVRDRTTAEDVAQEAFTRLFVNWAKVSQYERPGAWVRRVAIRLAVRHARRDRMRILLLRWVEPPHESDAADPDLMAAIRELPPQQRAQRARLYGVRHCLSATPGSITTRRHRPT